MNGARKGGNLTFWGQRFSFPINEILSMISQAKSARASSGANVLIL